MQQSQTQKIRKYCTITCCSTFIVLALILILNQPYNIGKYEGYVWIVTLALTEVAKYFYTSEKRHKIKLKNFIFGTTILSLSVIIFFISTVLLGAEISGQFEGTLMFSTLLATQCVLPVCLNLGGKFVSDVVNRKGCCEETVLSQTLIQNVWVTILGSWFGAFVIPLDWDRDWQAWPIPCSMGAILGYFTSNFVTAIGLSTHKNQVSKYKL